MIRFTDSLLFYEFDIGSSSGTILQRPKAHGATSQSALNIGVVLYIECCICKLNDSIHCIVII